MHIKGTFACTLLLYSHCINILKPTPQNTQLGRLMGFCVNSGKYGVLTPFSLVSASLTHSHTHSHNSPHSHTHTLTHSHTHTLTPLSELHPSPCICRQTDELTDHVQTPGTGFLLDQFPAFDIKPFL